MATIQDDDERLLARIGYKQVGPVHALNLPRDNLTEMIYVVSGIETRIFEVVHSFLCDIHPGRSRVRPGDVRISIGGWRACHRSVVLVHRVVYGHVHRQFRGGAGVCVSYRRRHVLRH